MNVVFDFGGVLFDWSPARLIAAAFPEQAPSAESAQALAHSVFGHPDWHLFDAGQVNIAEVVSRTVARLDLPVEPLLKLVETIGANLVPVPETLDILRELKQRRDLGGDVRLYYLSNMPAPYARDLEQRHPFLNWFDGGLFSGDVNLIKPDAAIYQLLQRQHHLVPEKTLFIDDLGRNVAAAQSLGWDGFLFGQPEGLRKKLLNM